MSHTLLSAGAGRLSLWLGGAALALGMFVRITRELIEGDVSAMDSAILLAVAKKRTPWLTTTAVDVTALGSITLVVLFSVFTLVVLLVLQDRLGALQLLTFANDVKGFTKNLLEGSALLGFLRFQLPELALKELKAGPQWALPIDRCCRFAQRCA